jgi:hypothetical protein
MPHGDGPSAIQTLLIADPLRVITNDFSSLTNGRCCLYRRLICPAACLRAKRQAWTAQQKWFAVELKRSLDKKLDDIIIAVKAKFDRDVVHRHCAWLKPETAAKINSSPTQGQSDTKREGSATIPSWSTRALWYRGTDARHRDG